MAHEHKAKHEVKAVPHKAAVEPVKAVEVSAPAVKTVETPRDPRAEYESARAALVLEENNPEPKGVAGLRATCARLKVEVDALSNAGR